MSDNSSGQHINIDSVTGNVNIAGRDIVQVGNKTEVEQVNITQQLIDDIRKTIVEDTTLPEEEKQDALLDVDNLHYELQKAKPRQERVSSLLGHLSKIASIGAFVAQLAQLCGLSL